MLSLAAGCGVDPQPPRLGGDWEITHKDGVVNPRPSETVFLFTEPGAGKPGFFIIGVEVDGGGYLHSDGMPYSTDTSQPQDFLDHEGNRDIAAEIGIFDFLDNDTVDWKTTIDQPRPVNFEPEPNYTLYRLHRMF